MHILILGGSVFVGRHIVERALALGHQLTLLNRGVQNAELFPAIEKLRGDRDADLSVLHGRRFDAVIDTCGYRPAQIQTVLAALGEHVPYYLFISTISVYGNYPPAHHFDEDTPLAAGEQDYGAYKARCEEMLEAAWPGRVAHVRPGLIVGPHDPTARFTYWPRRVAQGGDILAPGVPDAPVQWIDVRDLANWCVHLCEQQISGRFHVVGPQQPCTFGQLLAACQSVTQTDARLHWVNDAQLLELGVQPWTELPLWLPQDDAESGGMMLAQNRRALATGLTLRPLQETIAATLAWDQAQPAPSTPDKRRANTMTREREAQILAQMPD